MTTAVKQQNSRPGLQSLISPFDRFFKNELPDLWYKNVPATMASIDIIEEKNSYRFELAAPELKKEDINIDVDGNIMTIFSEAESGISKGDDKDSDSRIYSNRKYSYSSFSRSFNIPEDADGNNIRAKYQDGVLAIEIMKNGEGKEKEPKK